MKKQIIVIIMLIANLSTYSYGQNETESYRISWDFICTDTLIEQPTYKDTVANVVYITYKHPIYPSRKIQYFFPDTVYHILKELTRQIENDDYENRQYTVLLSKVDTTIYKLVLYTYDDPKDKNKSSSYVSNRICVVNNREIEIYLEEDKVFAFKPSFYFQYYVLTIIFTVEFNNEGRGGKIIDIYY